MQVKINELILTDANYVNIVYSLANLLLFTFCVVWEIKKKYTFNAPDYEIKLY